MKIKNKKTGEIASLEGELLFDNEVMLLKQYSSLAELNEEWKDYEEPKRTWFIDTNCVPNYIDYGDNPITDHCYDDWNELGICFETKEEAEKAVEKLKAWKRLKDKGFRFSKWFTRVEGGIQINVEYNKYDGIDLECREDLDLLFSGGKNVK